MVKENQDIDKIAINISMNILIGLIYRQQCSRLCKRRSRQRGRGRGSSSGVINAPVTSACNQQAIQCQKKSKYRTADGSCNNLQNKRWGQSGQTQPRWLPNDYSDGMFVVL